MLFRSPINHSSNDEDMKVYKVEPYVMAADVYANESHQGRGGWTWYTGSSGWMYQFIVNALLGMEKHGDGLKFKPCFPFDWPSVSINYRFGQSTYQITVFQERTKTDSWWKTKDIRESGDFIPLIDDGLEHQVEVHIAV